MTATQICDSLIGGEFVLQGIRLVSESKTTSQCRPGEHFGTRGIEQRPEKYEADCSSGGFVPPEPFDIRAAAKGSNAGFADKTGPMRQSIRGTSHYLFNFVVATLDIIAFTLSQRYGLSTSFNQANP
jgi:hypothetical protein